MATYSPLPFVPQRFDQTAQKLSLAQMMYEAEMARINMEQQRRMQIGQTLASLGSLPGQFFDIKNTLEQQALLQQQRQQQLATEQDYRRGLVAAQERENALRRDAMEQAQQRQQTEDVFRVGQATGRLSPEAFTALEGTPFAGAFGRVEQPMTTPQAPPPAATEGMMAPSARVPLAQMRYLPAVEAEAAERQKQEQAEAAERQKQEQAALTFAAIYEGANTAGYTPKESLMYAAKGQIPPPRPSAPLAKRFEMRNVGPNVVQFEVDPTGRVIGQQIVAAAPEKPEPPAKPRDLNQTQQIFQLLSGKPSQGVENYLPDTVKADTRKAIGSLPSSDREFAAMEVQNLASQPIDASNYENVLGKIGNTLANRLVAAQNADYEKTMIARLDGYRAFADFKRRFEQLRDAAIAAQPAGDRERFKAGLYDNTVEGAMKMIGRTTLPPEQFQLWKEIDRDYVEFRKLMTGVAFSDQEDRQYRSLIPQLKNTDMQMNINTLQAGMDAMISGAERFFDRLMGKELTTAYLNMHKRGYAPMDASSMPGMPVAPAAALGVTVGGRPKPR